MLNKTNPAKAASDGAITPPALNLISLPEHLASDKGFLSAYARSLAALALNDKSASLAELAALTEIARQTQYPALMGTQILQALEQGVDFERSLTQLGKVARDAGVQERQAAFALAQPLLALQAQQARALARRLATALDVTANDEMLAALPAELETSLISSLGSKWGNSLRNTARQLVLGKDKPDFLLEFGKSIGDMELMAHAKALQSGAVSQLESDSFLAQRLARVAQDIAQYRNSVQAASIGAAQAANQTMLKAAQELQQQIAQRLALIDARIAHERAAFAEDIEDLVHDAGNALENAISERLQSDKWQEKEVWASIANTQFGKEAQRRIERAIQRREQVLRLFKEELKLFQADLRVVQASIASRLHHTQLAQMMPPLRLGTRISNAVEDAANLTLGAGAVAVAGTGAAAYLLGSAVVLPFVAPAAPFVAGALAAAGIVKWFSDSDKRKISEIAHKRKAIEEVVRRQLQDAALAFNQQLDALQKEYQQSAISLLTPILLDAQAAQQLHVLHQKLALKMIEQTENTMRQLSVEMRVAMPSVAAQDPGDTLKK